MTDVICQQPRATCSKRGTRRVRVETADGGKSFVLNVWHCTWCGEGGRGDRPMKALTLTQPWAHLVVIGQKLVENRTWNPPRAMFGQRFAIHASREVDLVVMGWLRERKYGDVSYPDWTKLSEKATAYPLSAIVGVATLVDHVVAGTHKDKLPTSQHRWFVGPVGFVLANARALTTPVECKGSLGFWTLPEDVAVKVEAQL